MRDATRARVPGSGGDLLAVLGLFVLAVASGCGGEEAAQAGGEEAADVEAVEETEPNDQIGQATSVTLDRPFVLRFGEEGDRDWFRVEVPGPGYLDVQAGALPEELDLRVAVARHEEWSAEKEDWVKEWTSPPVAVRIAEAGSYHLAVRDQYDDYTSSESVQLRLRHIEEFDAHEPNDAPGSAADLALDEPFSFSIFPAGDLDWFRVSAPARSYLEAQAREVPEGIDLRVSFATYDEWAGEKRELRGWSDLPRAIFVPDSSAIYIGFQDQYGDGRSEAAVQARIRRLEDVDPHEPNDGPAGAASVAAGDTLRVAIFPAGDRDWFRVSLGEGRALGVTVLDAPELDLQVSLQRVETEGAEPEVVVEWMNLPAELTAEEAGEYFLVLRDRYDDDRDPTAFRLVTR